MKKIVPFKKDLIFKTEVEEVVSISLEHTLTKKSDLQIGGDFLISGDYKIAETSTSLEPFSYTLPFEINLDEKYNLENATIDINDFYYEIINNKVLSVNIEVVIDKLEEKEIVIEEKEEIPETNDYTEEPERCIDPEDTEVVQSVTMGEEIYKSYKVYIVREGDTIESIMEKYGVTLADLEDYNDVSKININDKIVIPTINEKNS
jgi:LysM repeat protein